MSGPFKRGRTLSPGAIKEARRWRAQRVRDLQKRFDDNPLSLTFKERHELQRLSGRIKGLVDSILSVKPDEESPVMAGPPVKELKMPEVKEVPPSVRHTQALRRKATLEPRIEEREKRQKRSRRCLKKATAKPTSGHKSPRPNRHMSKHKRQEVSTNAK